MKISMFDDRIEISSPGSLLPDISVEEYLNGQISVFRNPIISNIFFRLNYIEKLGTGIRRINEAYHESLVKPKYRVFENSILVILPVFNSYLDLSEKENEIVKCLNKHQLLTRNQLDKMIGFHKAKTNRVLKKLLEKDMIVKNGKGKTTKYQLKK
ncbi:ATP-binding protein [Allocoprobacillus halotolerans]|nr:ATP-binding protein [Allocoprobacillus halotolerans]